MLTEHTTPRRPIRYHVSRMMDRFVIGETRLIQPPLLVTGFISRIDNTLFEITAHDGTLYSIAYVRFDESLTELTRLLTDRHAEPLQVCSACGTRMHHAPHLTRCMSVECLGGMLRWKRLH